MNMETRRCSRGGHERIVPVEDDHRVLGVLEARIFDPWPLKLAKKDVSLPRSPYPIVRKAPALREMSCVSVSPPTTFRSIKCMSKQAWRRMFQHYLKSCRAMKHISYIPYNMLPVKNTTLNCLLSLKEARPQ